MAHLQQRVPVIVAAFSVVAAITLQGALAAAAGRPSIRSFSPRYVNPGVTVVTVTGTNFVVAQTSVSFNGRASSQVSVISTSRLTTLVPAGATAGKISLTTPSGTAVSGSAYKVLPSPTVRSFTPTFGRVGTRVEIVGSNFTPGLTFVTLGGKLAQNVAVLSSTDLRFRVPSGATSSPIRVLTPTGAATSSSSFTVGSAPAKTPSITSFSPASGASGTTVTIHGSNFTANGTRIIFDGVPATVHFISPTVLQTRVPEAASTGPITVKTARGSVTSVATFSVIHPPTISSFSPISGSVGTLITIIGSHFVQGGTTVKIAGASSTSVTYLSASKIQATVPEGATSGTIQISTADGVATSRGSFIIASNQPLAVVNGNPVRTGQRLTASVSAHDSGDGIASVQFYDNGVPAGQPVTSYSEGTRNPANYSVTVGDSPTTLYDTQTAATHCGSRGNSWIPDLPARAFRDADGQIELITGSPSNYRLIGTDFNDLTLSCSPILRSPQQSNPSLFSDFNWIGATYTADSRTVYALVHQEYHGWLYPQTGCRYGSSDSKENRYSCWYSALTFAVSTDGGRTFTDSGQLVAASPFKYMPNVGTANAGYGMETPSGIVRNPVDGYYYALISQIAPIDAASLQPSVSSGTCLIRTSDLSDPASWHAWGGNSFNISFGNPYAASIGSVCKPISIGISHGGLTYNTYLHAFVVVGVNASRGISTSTSTDLIHWTAPHEISANNDPCNGRHYPTIIDPSSSSLSFDTSGQTALLLYSQFHFNGSCTATSRSLDALSLRFVDTNPRIYSYNWTAGSSYSGQHTITALVTDSSGATATAQVTVTVR